MPLALRLENLVKTYGGVRALKGVSLDVRAGEVHAIVGENGAGKSTLIKIVAGAVQPDEGRIFIGDAVYERLDPQQSRRLGVAVIYQQPALFADLTVAENMALRLEDGRAWRLVRWGERHRRAADLLARVGADFTPDVRVRDLSMPQQQLLEIATALGGDARILILDEPTASLSDQEADNLFRVIEELRKDGVAMLYISHRLEELPRVADRITVLRDGAYIGTRVMKEVDRPMLIRMMVGRDVSAVFPKVDVAPGEVVLSAEGVSCSASGIRDVTFEVRAGEILGLAGLVGAGGAGLARTLFGLTPADSGRIFLRGRSVRVRSPAEAVRLGIAYVPEDRRRHGVVLEMSVAANATLAVLRQVAAAFIIRRSEEQKLAQSFINGLAIKTPSTHTPVGHLSGGNQQKVALSRWLAAKPAVLILDEPTQGVDVGAKSEIHRLMGELARQGIAIIMISSELPEILAMSDRIAVMREGRIVRLLPRDEATQETVLEWALGEKTKALTAPSPVLQEHGQDA